MNNKSFKQLLENYKKSIIVEGFSDSKLLRTLVDDAKNTTNLWLEIDISEFLDADKRTQMELIKDSLDNYIEDVRDDIDSELPDGINTDEWVKKNGKKLISLICKELNK